MKGKYSFPGFLQPYKIIVQTGYQQLRILKPSSILMDFFVINSEILNSTSGSKVYFQF